MLLTTALLCGAAFVAGFIDAVAGGGGLVQVPALLVLLPGVPVPTLLGTSKLAGMVGTGSAAADYLRRSIPVRWSVILPATLACGAMAWTGSHAVSDLPKAALRPMVLGLLVLVAAYTLLKKDFGALHRPHPSVRTELLLGLAGAAAIGFYDGFFGPGTGSFLIFFLVGALGYDFLSASAAAKVLNVGSNVASITYFAGTGQILWAVGLPMAASQLLGAQLGTRMAVRHGTAFVRPLFLLVAGAGILRLAWDILRTP